MDFLLVTGTLAEACLPPRTLSAPGASIMADLAAPAQWRNINSDQTPGRRAIA
jgi:hypothetical protein